MALPQAPLQDLKKLPYSYQQWFNSVRQFVSGNVGSIPWSTVSKSGSNLTDLTVRNHYDLQNVDGGGVALEQFHLSQPDYVSITALTTVSANTNLDRYIHGTVLVNASGGARVITLSSATGRTTYHIKKIDSSVNTVTVQRSGSDVIEGGTTHVLTAQYDSVTLYSDGSGTWYIKATT